MNCRLPGSSVHGIFQARIPFPSPGDLPNPGIEPRSSALLEDLHINIVCLALELVGSWVVVGFSVGMEAFG